MIGSANTPHTWTDVADMARTLVSAAGDDSALGRTWHVPSNPARTQEQAINDVLDAVGKPHVKVTALPAAALAVAALVSPMLREVQAMSYGFTRPFILDDTAARAHFGIEPTPWGQVCRRTAEQ